VGTYTPQQGDVAGPATIETLVVNGSPPARGRQRLGSCQGHLSAHRIPAPVLAKAGMRGNERRLVQLAVLTQIHPALSKAERSNRLQPDLSLVRPLPLTDETFPA
jgi:hypothetical protein